jgi:hypothetical protein
VSQPSFTGIDYPAIRTRFLRLAVERTLEAKADELKEYVIGVEVFDRGASYDPRIDPVVRVEASPPGEVESLLLRR